MPISWNDFKENPGYDKYYRKRAKTHWRLSIDIVDSNAQTNNQLKVNVEAILIRSLSWVRSTNRIDNNLLIHEQLHFDMVEWFARRLRETLSKENFSIENYKKKIKNLYRNSLKELRNKQSDYDFETHGGNSLIEQNQWAKEIIEGIKGLREFSSSSVIITLQ